MPNYDFLCPECGQLVEKNIPLRDTPLVICSKCNETMEKLPAAPGIVKKGAGWTPKFYN